MILTLLLAIGLAKWRHYKVRYLFQSWTIYPFLVVQGLIFLFQTSIFMGSTVFIRFAPYVSNSVILSFLFMILHYQLYLPAIVGSVSVLLGTVMNKFVIAQNNGRMPVFPSLSYFTGYATAQSFSYDDGLHVLGSAATRWKWLSDYIDVGYSVLSPGDLFIHLFSVIMLYQAIKSANVKYNEQHAR